MRKLEGKRPEAGISVVSSRNPENRRNSRNEGREVGWGQNP